MRLGTLIVIALVLIVVCCIFRKHIFEAFTATNTLQLSWTPSGPNPSNIAYNWGVCISQGGGSAPYGKCSAQTPPYPPGLPGPAWDYHGQTAQGQASIVLNNTNCGFCGFGQVLTLLLQAVDVVNPTHPTSSWAAFTLDLSSKATAIKNTITDVTAPSQPVYPGSTGCIYTLQLNQP